MRVQSSIEFLTTYSFLFLVLGLVISILVFLVATPSIALPSTCSAFGGPNCNFIQVYSNPNTGFSVTTFSLTNSESVPINMTNVSVTVKGVAFRGFCTPQFLYQGEETICTVNMTQVEQTSTLLQGFYSVNAKFCNSVISNVSKGNCMYANVIYAGSFSTQPLTQKFAPFSVIASRAPSGLQLLPFNAFASGPIEPNNFTVLNNAGWVSNFTRNLTYGYGSINGLMPGNIYFGYNVLYYPKTLPGISNGNVACSYPYNSVFSVASTTIYLNSSGTIGVNIETQGAIEMYYRSAIPGNAWANVLTGGGWKNQPNPTAYPNNAINLQRGIYNIEVVWSNPCASGGQFLSLTGVPFN